MSLSSSFNLSLDLNKKFQFVVCRLHSLPAKMSKEIQSESSAVRIGHSLNEAEKNHVDSRRESILQCLRQHNIHCRPEEVPNIALLGSGGGERAMIGLMGSLVQLYKDGLLDCLLYLSGVSGSTWCMASLYKETDWSSRLVEVKDDFIKRLNGDGVSFPEKLSKLKKYYQKDNFSLTDIWAALVISELVQEIDERPLSDQRSGHSRDPYPIYTIVDQQSNREKMEADNFFEITPHEVGYSITGAFVDSSCFGCEFDEGIQKKSQPEMDMLYLQGLCGSVFADYEKILENLLGFIKSLHWLESEMMCNTASGTETHLHLLHTPNAKEVFQVIFTLVELNLLVFREQDPSSHIEILNNLLRGKLNEEENETIITLQMMTEGIAKKHILEKTVNVCKGYAAWLQKHLNHNGTWMLVIKCIELVSHWVWGTTYNYLYNMTAQEVSPHILKEKTRCYEDAGLFINSPYFSVLRKERQVDLIISLDFSENDPFETVVKTAETCRKLHIPFPEVHISETDKRSPRDFYVFESRDAPTVIHIPLFNIINCEGDVHTWKKKYATFQTPYSSKMINDLLEKAEVNIKNNKVAFLKEIQKVIKRKITNHTVD